VQYDSRRNDASGILLNASSVWQDSKTGCTKAWRSGWRGTAKAHQITKPKQARGGFCRFLADNSGAPVGQERQP